MNNLPRFRNRVDAGQRLAGKLVVYAGKPNVLVLGLPRGGVPVAYEVARRLRLPLDVFVVRKLGVPGQEELAMGAIASGGMRVINQQVVQLAGITPAVIESVTTEQQQELGRRERLYRGDRPFPNIRGRTVILIDDGLATGATMRVATEALRQRSPAEIVVAVPVAPPETCNELRAAVDEIVCAETPSIFGGVGLWYEDFSQTSDEEVRLLLQESTQWLISDRAGAASSRDR